MRRDPLTSEIRRLAWRALCGGSLLWLTACGGSSGGGGPLPPSSANPGTTPTTPTTPIDPSLPAAACLNTALYSTAGTRTALTYTSEGGGSTQQVQQFATVAAIATTFNGQTANALNVREVVQTVGTPSSEVRFDGTHYVALSDHQVQLLGTVSRYRSQGSMVTQTLALSPSLTDLDFRLAVGGSTVAASSVISASVSPASGAGTASLNASSAVTFVGFETITVPAGTFTDACKFEQRVTTGSSRVTTRWLAKGSGVVLRVDAGGTIQRLVSGTLNGAVITP
ncbi:MAG: hypothetical protein WAQ08_21140 [Aquabacterium sp.]|jgi:hypothetical protein|uniref:hypothetical protein n=1 Tax=Aquabacterium sp. TaxID=1872578 RepID=UPI003BAF9174